MMIVNFIYFVSFLFYFFHVDSFWFHFNSVLNRFFYHWFRPNCLNLFHLLLVPTHLTVARMHIFISLVFLFSRFSFGGKFIYFGLIFSYSIQFYPFVLLTIYKKTQDAHIIHNTIQQTIQSIFGFYDFYIILLLFFLLCRFFFSYSLLWLFLFFFFLFLKTHGGCNSRTFIADWYHR